MKKRILFTVASLLLIVSQSFATSSPTVYTDEASFLSALGSSYYLEEFGDVVDQSQFTSFTRSSGDYGYAVSDNQSVYYSLYIYGYNNTTQGSFITTGESGDSLCVINSGKKINAFGGYFFSADMNGSLDSKLVTIKVGTYLYQFTPTTTTSFRGFIFTDSIDSMKIAAPKVSGGTNGFAAIDHFYVGNNLTTTKLPVAKGSGVSVYPTVVTGSLNIASATDIVSVEVSDYLGKTIITSKVSTINLSSLPSGIYFVKVTTADGVATKKIIKK